MLNASLRSAGLSELTLPRVYNCLREFSLVLRKTFIIPQYFELALAENTCNGQHYETIVFSTQRLPYISIIPLEHGA